MEDAHTVHLYLPPSDPSRKITPSPDIPQQPAGSTVTNDNEDDEEPEHALFGVFDGHGGSSVAKYTGTTLHTRLAGLESYKNGDFEAALKQSFLKTDEDLRADPNFFNDPSGCTSVVGLITKDGRIIVANSGDSRSVLGYKGQAKAMSNDHKPTNKEETARITSAGGFVEFGRVNGNLALSRAIGDFEFKQNYSLAPEKQIVTADPEIITHKIDGEEEFLVLACDGIWDCLSSQQVIDFTRRAIANGDELGKIAEDMMVKCLATDSETGGIGCDNMTVIIVALLGGRTPEEWQAWVKERVDNKVGYDTPASVPDIFGQSQASTGPRNALSSSGFRVAGAGGLANIASILGASGITFKPEPYDSDDDDDEIQIIGEDGKGIDVNADKLDAGLLGNEGVEGKTKPRDVTDELDDDKAEQALKAESKKGSVELLDEDGDSAMDSGDDSDSTTTGDKAGPSDDQITKAKAINTSNTPPSPIPPSFSSIGSPTVPTPQALQRSSLPSNKQDKQYDQLRSDPQGDAPSGAVKVEGLMDTSENPLKL
nr:PP2Cc protein phosphatase [Kwoniella bestiolae CBS 10118]OCF29631.1 PP2Cc protein phosphatase [Kwoniella bestiolae CBS 10118]